jgi:hydroxymethylpyrimidine/phosphomethylpyrimidine kinase
LTDKTIVDLEGMRKAVEKLARKYGVPSLLKGGHLRQTVATDLFFSHGRVSEFSAPFVRGVTTHGTGCTYSAAITAGLACGLSLDRAICSAKEFVSATIVRHLKWQNSAGKSVYALNHLPSGPRG